MDLIANIAMNLRWPVGCPSPPAGKNSVEFVRGWVRNNPSETQLRKTSYAAYIGLGISVFGIITGFLGKLKENKFLKVLGWTLGWIGAAGAVVGKLFGLEFDIANGVKNTVIAGGTNGKQITPAELEGMRADKVDITSGGEKLDGYYIYAPNGQTKKTLIYIHGIRNNVGDCLKEIQEIQKNLNVNVIVFDPRGFGNSKLNADSITCQGLNEDALEVYKYLETRGLKSEDISVFGHSLGGAMAVQLAKEKEVDTLILQSTFTDAEQARKDGIGGYIPDKLARMFGLLGLDDFNSEVDITKIKAKKVLAIHGTEDSVIPCKHSERLNESLSKLNIPKENKIFAKLPGASHGNYIDFYEKAEIYDASRKKDDKVNLYDKLNECIFDKRKEHDEAVISIKIPEANPPTDKQPA